MKYSLIWTPKSEQNLTRLWNVAADKPAITSAANEIDAILRARPSDAGESREDDTRILIVAPLAVLFDVKEADCRVVVWSVWLSKNSD